MDLRWCLAVVTGAGSGLGHDVAVRLGRLGVAVLAVDVDLAAASATAEDVAERRVRAWALGVDVATEEDRRLLAARCRDLGGADLLVDALGGPGAAALTVDFLDGLAQRRGRRAAAAAVRVVLPGGERPAKDPDETRARLIVLVGGTAADVVDLLAHGAHGEVRVRPSGS